MKSIFLIIILVFIGLCYGCNGPTEEWTDEYRIIINTPDRIWVQPQGYEGGIYTKLIVTPSDTVFIQFTNQTGQKVNLEKLIEAWREKIAEEESEEFISDEEEEGASQKPKKKSQ